MSTRQHQQDSAIAERMHAQLNPRSGGQGHGMQAATPAMPRKMAASPTIQRKCEACQHEEEEAVQQKEQGLSIQKQEGSAAPPPTGGEEEEMLGGMPKAQFFTLLEDSICNAVDSQLVGTPYTALGCPWIRFWIDEYKDKPVAEIEQAIATYGDYYPGDSEGMIYLITAEVKKAVDIWRKTGLVTGTPDFYEEIDCEMSLQNKGDSPTGAHDPLAVRDRLGGGQAMSAQDQSRFSTAFGSSFSDVRIHTDSTAVQLSRQMGARAFTVGNHVAFNSGEYRPGSITGDALMAHELAHVQQQRGGETRGMQAKGGSTYDALEADADTAAVGVVGRLWGQAKEYTQGIGQRTGAALRTGLRLQGCLTGCSSEKDVPEQIPDDPTVGEDNKKAKEEAGDRSKEVVDRAKEVAEEVKAKEDAGRQSKEITDRAKDLAEEIKKENIKKIESTSFPKGCKNEKQLPKGIAFLVEKIKAGDYPAFAGVDFSKVPDGGTLLGTLTTQSKVNPNKYYDKGYYSKYRDIYLEINDQVKTGWQPDDCAIIPYKYTEEYYKAKERERLAPKVEALKKESFSVKKRYNGASKDYPVKFTDYELFWVPHSDSAPKDYTAAVNLFLTGKTASDYFEGVPLVYDNLVKDVNTIARASSKLPKDGGYYIVIPKKFTDPFIWEQEDFTDWKGKTGNADLLKKIVAVIYAEQSDASITDQRQYIWQSIRLQLKGFAYHPTDIEQLLEDKYTSYPGSDNYKAAIAYLTADEAARKKSKFPKKDLLTAIETMVKDEWKKDYSDASEQYFHVRDELSDKKDDINKKYKACSGGTYPTDPDKWEAKIKRCAVEAANKQWAEGKDKYKVEKVMPGHAGKRTGKSPEGYMFVMKLK